MFAVGCYPRGVEHPLGTWRGRDNGAGDVVLELSEDEKFTITQRPDLDDTRNYMIVGTFVFDFSDRSRFEGGTYGQIEFFVEASELEGMSVESLRAEENSHPAYPTVPIQVRHRMWGTWTRLWNGTEVSISATCSGPEGTGDCWSFQGDLVE